MNGPFGPSGGSYPGEGANANFIPAPTDVRSALQYTALASITPASAVINDLPPLSIAFRDYSMCNLNDPQYALIASMLENHGSSHVDLDLQQQLQAVRGLLNQVDVSYVRFKCPPSSVPLPSFGHPSTPPPSIPQKRPFGQAIDVTQNIVQPRKEKQYRSSPEVLIETPPREKLNQYRSSRSAEPEWGQNSLAGKRRSSQDLKKARERDQEDERNSGDSAMKKVRERDQEVERNSDSVMKKVRERDQEVERNSDSAMKKVRERDQEDGRNSDSAMKKVRERDQEIERNGDSTMRKARERDQEDERNGDSAMNKLVNFISTIFEAEDSINPDNAANYANSLNSGSIFIPSTLSSNEPLLSTSSIRQLIKFVGKVRRYRRLEEAEVDDLARLLKIMERSIRDVEALDILPKSSAAYPSNNKSNTNRSGSSTPRFPPKNLELMSVDGDESVDDNMDYDAKIQQIETKIDKIMNGLEAAIGAFSIMTAGKLSKQLYPEDLIISSLNLVKNLLNGVIYRILEMSSDTDELNNTDSTLSEIVENSRIRRQLTALLPAITTFLQRLYDLMQQELSDSVVIIVGFIAVGPFFVDSNNNNSSSILGSGGLEGVKLVSLGLLRSIFTNHQKQRTWILEEILTSLIKLPTAKRNLRQYRLPDGKSIQMVSALILQLIQSCTAGLGERRPRSTDDERESEKVKDKTDSHPNDLQKVIRAWKSGIDAASANAGYVFKFLLMRCTKMIKNSNESDYRILLDNFMEDVITVLNYPEWPAAELAVRIFSKIMVGYIDDKKADTYTKSMAIDYLGTIAGRIKKFVNSGVSASDNNQEGMEEKDTCAIIDNIKEFPKGEISILSPVPSVKNLWDCQKKVLTFLELGAMEDPSLQSARHFYLSEWGCAFANSLLSISQDPYSTNDGDIDEKDENTVHGIKKLLDKIVKDYWRMSSECDVKQILDYRQQNPERSEVLLVTELLATRQSLCQSFDSILSRILVSLDMSVVAFRTKALRALGQVVVCDPSILSQVNVRNTIAQRLQDNSPAVRDAAIDLVGRYLAQKPEITEQYYKVISDRVLDTGLNVRKRVIKLLRDIYLKSNDQAVMIDIGCKILTRINDDDDHVKELALKTVQELWLAPFKHQKSANLELETINNQDDEGPSEFSNMSAAGKKEVLSRSLLVVGVAGKLGERNSHILGGLFKKVLEKDGKQKRETLSICQCMVDCLFEHLLTLQDTNSKTEVVSCISTICLLSNASPSLVRRHVLTLQPYLKGASTSEDQAIMYYVLLIYRSVLSLLKRPSPTFLSEVEQSLLSLAKSPQKVIRSITLV